MKKVNMNGLTAVILAGGLQTRFREISDIIPKAMSSVGIAEQPNLVLLVEYLLSKGISKILIVAGFLAPIIQDRFESWVKRGVEVIVDPEGEILETGGAMKIAIHHLLKDANHATSNILYWNPDTLVTLDPIKLYAHHCRLNLPATIALTNDPAAPNFGSVKVFFRDGVAYISSFDEDKSSILPDNFLSIGLAHAGVGIIQISTLIKALFDPDRETKATLCMWSEIMPEIVKVGATAYISSGRFLEWGTPERYKTLLQHPEWIEVAYAI